MATNKFMPPKGKTWKRAFHEAGKKVPVELNGAEVKIILAGLIHFQKYLEKEERFTEVKEVEKLFNDFYGIDDFIAAKS